MSLGGLLVVGACVVACFTLLTISGPLLLGVVYLIVREILKERQTMNGNRIICVDDKLGEVTEEEVLRARHILQEIGEGTLVSNIILEDDEKLTRYLTNLINHIIQNPEWDGKPVRFSARVAAGRVILTVIVQTTVLDEDESPTPPPQSPEPPEPPEFKDRRWMSMKTYKNALAFWYPEPEPTLYVLWKEGSEKPYTWESLKDEAQAHGYSNGYAWLESILGDTLGGVVIEEYREYGQVSPNWLLDPTGRIFYLASDGWWEQVREEV